MKFLYTFSLLFVLHGSRAQEDPARYGVHHEDLPQGLALGAKVPEVQLSDQFARNFNLAEAYAKGPVIITFYRGNWCPHCNRYLSQLSDTYPRFKALGAVVVAISPEHTLEVQETQEMKQTPFHLLSDVDGRVMEAFDVDFRVTEAYQDKVQRKLSTDIGQHNEQETAILPVAATYLIDQSGRVVYRHFDLDYSQRASMEELLSALEKL